MLDELREAAEVYEHGEPSTYRNQYTHIHQVTLVRTADPTHNEAKMKLAEIYEILNEPRKALELVYEGYPLPLVSSAFPYVLCLCSH